MLGFFSPQTLDICPVNLLWYLTGLHTAPLAVTSLVIRCVDEEPVLAAQHYLDLVLSEKSVSGSLSKYVRVATQIGAYCFQKTHPGVVWLTEHVQSTS